MQTMNDNTLHRHSPITHPMHAGRRPPARQRGAVLFISLIMLLLLTIIGVTAMNNVTLEERMAGNLRDSDLSFQAAEAGLRTGENSITALLTPPAECTDPNNACPTANIWAAGAQQNLQNNDYSWWAGNGRPTALSLNHVATDPSLIVEYQKFVRDSFSVGHSNPTGSNFYLVTSQGVGGTNTAVTILQTSIVKRFN